MYNLFEHGKTCQVIGAMITYNEKSKKEANKFKQNIRHGKKTKNEFKKSKKK